ncbi:hypothetical protein BCR32DRAFT_264945 [Anaeromyces robustus]|uniref:Kinesin-like protein KIF6/9 C-terminal domain-containing protein n=1 Tax=Anaeromyces robustus TaxID=1754192 RepID=A0A1Y1XLM7_9FUNG|nr:hypothetical protein BCR32DRAFT_264945 [Anaeromyces robustus]|eukprot:ORX86406.1 hypothetical protein BCR32DRAFT_264945 [Anaeromyces robustus]
MVNEYKMKDGESNVTLDEIKKKSKVTSTISSEIYLKTKTRKKEYNDSKNNNENDSDYYERIENDNNKKISITLSPDEKIKAYNIFIQTYEPQKWIEEQKLLLKAKYIEAKQLGETANSFRNTIKSLKAKLINGVDNLTPEEKTEIGSQASEYASKYQKSYRHLKEMKIEIEHIQHLLEKARYKLTKDFEFWILNNYSTDSKIFSKSNKSIKDTSKDNLNKNGIENFNSIKTGLRSREPSTEYSVKSNKALSEKTSSTSESTLYNSNSISSLYGENHQFSEKENIIKDNESSSSFSSYSLQNNYEYNNNKYSKINHSRPSSSLSYSKRTNESPNSMNDYPKLKPNPLANSVDPNVIQYNPNLMKYNKLISSSNNNNKINRKSFNYSNVNGSIKDDINAFMKTKNNLEKRMIN